MKQKRKMSYKEQKKIVRDTILGCSKAFSLEDNLHSEHHKNNIRRGKLLLKLLSTVGTPDMLTWLSSAEHDGNFYSFKTYLIVKKTHKVKDSIDIKKAEAVIDVAKKCFGHEGEPKIFGLIDSHSQGQEYDVDKAKYLIPALTLMLGKMANIVSRTEYSTGEIYDKKDMSKPVDGVDLIDLYMQQENIDNKGKAIDELCAILRFDISQNIFDEAEIDKRTRWKYNPLEPETMESPKRPESCQTLVFYDGKLFLGDVCFDNKGIIAPTTVWSKNNDISGHRLETFFNRKF